MIEPNYPKPIDIILLCNVWSGGCSEHKTVGFHWIALVSLMALLWSQRVPADSQWCDEIILPCLAGLKLSVLAEVWLLSWQSGLYILVTRHVDTPVSASQRLHLCDHFPSVVNCVWHCQSKINTWDFMDALYPYSLIHHVKPHHAFTVSFYVRS